MLCITNKDIIMIDEERIKEQIKDLCNLYEYTEIDRITSTIIFETRWGILGKHKPTSWFSTMKGLAEAIKLLRHCTSIQIQGTNKGYTEKVDINNEDTRNLICKHLEEELNESL